MKQQPWCYTHSSFVYNLLNKTWYLNFSIWLCHLSCPPLIITHKLITARRTDPSSRSHGRLYNQILWCLQNKGLPIINSHQKSENVILKAWHSKDNGQWQWVQIQTKRIWDIYQTMGHKSYNYQSQLPSDQWHGWKKHTNNKKKPLRKQKKKQWRYTWHIQKLTTISSVQTLDAI